MRNHLFLSRLFWNDVKLNQSHCPKCSTFLRIHGSPLELSLFRSSPCWALWPFRAILLALLFGGHRVWIVTFLAIPEEAFDLFDSWHGLIRFAPGWGNHRRGTWLACRRRLALLGSLLRLRENLNLQSLLLSIALWVRLWTALQLCVNAVIIKVAVWTLPARLLPPFSRRASLLWHLNRLRMAILMHV